MSKMYFWCYLSMPAITHEHLSTIQSASRCLFLPANHILSLKSHCLLFYFFCNYLPPDNPTVSRSKHFLYWKLPITGWQSKNLSLTEQNNRRTTSWLNQWRLDYLVKFRTHITKTHAYLIFIHTPPHKHPIKVYRTPIWTIDCGYGFMCT